MAGCREVVGNEKGAEQLKFRIPLNMLLRLMMLSISASQIANVCVVQVNADKENCIWIELDDMQAVVFCRRSLTFLSLFIYSQ